MTTFEAQNFLNTEFANLSDSEKDAYQVYDVIVPEIGTMTAHFGSILGYVAENGKLKYQTSERTDKAISHLRIVSSISYLNRKK